MLKLIMINFLANQKVLIDLTSFGQLKKIFPGAMTIDHSDNLYVTMFGGSKIIVVNTK